MEWTDDNGATWSSARITPMENAPRWESIIIVPERELLKRDGVIGKILDWFFPRYKYNASPGFIAISSDGQHIVTSPDGKTWTAQTTPLDGVTWTTQTIPIQHFTAEL